MKTLIRLTLAALLATTMSCSDDDGGGGNTESAGAESPPSEDVADITDDALALEDLPDGWAEDNGEDDDNDNTLDCLKSLEDEVEADGLTGNAEVTYMEGTGIPTLNQLLAQYEDADTAAAVLDTLDSVLDECGSFESETDEGEPFTGQIGKVQFPDVEGATQQINYQMTADTGGVSVSAAMIGLQVDTYVTFLYWVDLGSFEPDAVAEVATTAVGKLA